jgi:thiol-disulfide isomerase/thioredoxin
MVRFAAAAIVILAVWGVTPAHGAEVLMLDFWSPQCGPCMQMKPTIQSFKKAGYPIREVDVTQDRELARKFQVDRIPCFVMLVDDQEVDRTVGFTDSTRLQGMFKEAHEAARRLAETRRGQSPDPVRPQQPANPTANGDQSTELSAKLLSSTVRLRVDDAQGHSYGTGTIIDARSGQALVVTCGHLFRESQGKGPIRVELFEGSADGARAIGEVRAQVISYDLKRDIALVGIWPDRPVTVARIAARGSNIKDGDRVLCVGCSNGQDPTVLASRITSLDRYQGPPNIEASGAPVEGRSGGGLFNSQGELIGVCYAADYESNEGLYAALESIHDELAARGLGDISNSAVVAAGAAGERSPAGADSLVVRGQEPLTPVLPIPDQAAAVPAVSQEGETIAIEPGPSGPNVPQGLSAVEQAAWEEIMTRAATAEVICIIRPKEPGGQSEVITLDEVSPEFVRALAERSNRSRETSQR